MTSMRLHIRGWRATFWLGLGLVNASAQTLDPNFNPGADSFVFALAAQPGGRILVGGAFNRLAGQSRNFVGRLNGDGSLDRSFAPALNGVVRSIALQPDGKIILGGQFTTVGGLSRNKVARLNADGSLDTSFDPGAGANATVAIFAEVFCLVLQPDGKIVLGGGFDTINGQTRNGLARLNPDGSLDANFDPEVTGVFVSTPNAARGLLCLALQADGKIVFGGQFLFVAGQPRNGFARVNADGSLDTGFNPSTTPAGFRAVAVQADGRILTGGSSVRLAGQLVPNLGRLNADGSLDSSFSVNLSGTLSSVFPQSDGRLLVNVFPGEVGAQHSTLVRLTSFGAAEGGFNFDLTSENALVFAPAAAVLLQGDGAMIFGGNFNAVAGVPRNNLARLLPPAPSRLANFSTRGFVAASGDLTVGFTARGVGAKSLLVRAAGPALGAFGVGGTLATPRVDAIPAGASLATGTNDGWRNDPALAAAFGAVGAFAFPSGSKDAALVTSLAPGGMTVRVTSGTPGGDGIVLAEIYDRDAVAAVPRLANLSTLGFVGSGAQVLVPGFVMAGEASKQLLIRAVGPGLAPFGVGGVLADPQIAIVPLGSVATIASNDNWANDPALVAAFGSVGAFSLPANSKDAALVVRLPPGAYTVVVSGVGGTTGRALVEIYDLDP